MSDTDTTTQVAPIAPVKNYGRRLHTSKTAKKRKLNILYVASEMAPFLETADSQMAQFVRTISQSMQERGMEIRIIVPRFGLINERKNRLHEVLRLSGLNIAVGFEKKSLVIKVASVPNARMQAYFIDNDDYFRRKAMFFDKEKKFYADNDERLIFFCKAVLETIRKLGWAPDVIHCNGWMTSLIPLYLKTLFKQDPLLAKTKCIYTLHEALSSVRFADNMLDKIKGRQIDERTLDLLKERSLLACMRLGAHYADCITRADSLDPKVLAQVKDGIHTETPSIAADPNTLSNRYHHLYDALVD